MDTTNEAGPPAPPSACARCGTFAPLQDNGWRVLCAPCAQLSRHPLEGVAPDFSAIMTATARTWLELWPFAVPLALAAAAPHALVAWLYEAPWWFDLAYSIVIGSFAEALLLSVAAEWAFGGRRDLRRALARVEQRYFAAAGVNLVVGVGVLLGMFTCVLGILLAAVMQAAIPLALFERAHPLTAIAEAWRRSRGRRLTLVAVTSLVLLPLLAFSMSPAVVGGTLRALHVELTLDAVASMRAASVLVLALGNTVPQVLQLAAWQATRPAPAAPADAPG